MLGFFTLTLLLLEVEAGTSGLVVCGVLALARPTLTSLFVLPLTPLKLALSLSRVVVLVLGAALASASPALVGTKRTTVASVPRSHTNKVGLVDGANHKTSTEVLGCLADIPHASLK